jgi:hypothetical protein
MGKVKDSGMFNDWPEIFEGVVVEARLWFRMKLYSRM